jgi:uncharacterized protein (DUF1810 family)
MTLQRFLDAQEPVIDIAMAELRAGRKRSHWMWFVFPQLKQLGRSGTAKFYGIEGLQEARDYLAHPVLGPRLLACTEAILRHAGKTANAILGSPDDLKFRSCMTLFSRAAPEQPLFKTALDTFFVEEDSLTVDLLRPQQG